MDSWMIKHFSQANPAGTGQDDVPALLRRVADSIERRGSVQVQDLVMRWVRDAVGRQVIMDIGTATNPLHGGRMAPFTEDSLHVRIGRIANWAGVLRLAARSGGWVLQPVVGRRPPHPAGMTELLSGIYAVGVWAGVFD